MCRQLYDLHINSMTYTLFFIPDYQFHKVFFNVFLGNNFLLFLCGGPIVVEALGSCPVCPPLKSGPATHVYWAAQYIDRFKGGMRGIGPPNLAPASCPFPKNPYPRSGPFGPRALALRASSMTGSRRVGPSQHEGLDSPMPVDIGISKRWSVWRNWSGILDSIS